MFDSRGLRGLQGLVDFFAPPANLIRSKSVTRHTVTSLILPGGSNIRMRPFMPLLPHRPDELAIFTVINPTSYIEFTITIHRIEYKATEQGETKKRE